MCCVLTATEDTAIRNIDHHRDPRLMLSVIKREESIPSETTLLCCDRDSNTRSSKCKTNALPTAPPLWLFRNEKMHVNLKAYQSSTPCEMVKKILITCQPSVCLLTFHIFQILFHNHHAIHSLEHCYCGIQIQMLECFQIMIPIYPKIMKVSRIL